MHSYTIALDGKELSIGSGAYVPEEDLNNFRTADVVSNDTGYSDELLSSLIHESGFPDDVEETLGQLDRFKKAYVEELFDEGYNIADFAEVVDSVTTWESQEDFINSAVYLDTLKDWELVMRHIDKDSLIDDILEHDDSFFQFSDGIILLTTSFS